MVQALDNNYYKLMTKFLLRQFNSDHQANLVSRRRFTGRAAGYAETPKGLIQTLFETPFPGFNANTVFETPRLFFVRRYCS